MTKTFDPRNIFTPFTIELAKKFEGKSGYFSNSYNTDLSQWTKGFLQLGKGFICTEPTSSYSAFFQFFIPDELVREEEKKYRPFKNCEELCQYVTPIHYHGVILNVGDKVIIRNKQNGYTYKVLITELCYESKFIGFGTCPFSLAELYNQYEWQDVLNKTWQPFGVIEE